MVIADVPVQLAVLWPYHVPRLAAMGGVPRIITSRILKHVPLLDILAAAHVIAVVVEMLTLGEATVEGVTAAKYGVSDGSTDGMPMPTHGAAAPFVVLAQT